MCGPDSRVPQLRQSHAYLGVHSQFQTNASFSNGLTAEMKMREGRDRQAAEAKITRGHISNEKNNPLALRRWRDQAGEGRVSEGSL